METALESRACHVIASNVCPLNIGGTIRLPFPPALNCQDFPVEIQDSFQWLQHGIQPHQTRKLIL